MKNLITIISGIVFFLSMMVTPDDDATAVTYIIWIAVFVSSGLVCSKTLREENK